MCTVRAFEFESRPSRPAPPPIPSAAPFWPTGPPSLPKPFSSDVADPNPTAAVVLSYFASLEGL